MNIISLGWGTQSFTLAAMVALGELEPVYAAVHSDTGHEMSGTYDFAKRWTPWLEDRGVKVVTVQAEDNSVVSKYDFVQIPAFSKDGKKLTQMKRQCTSEWKIFPLRRWVKAQRKFVPEIRRKELVDLWIGITTDEAARMKPSGLQYITHKWPLVDMGFSRNDCISWLEERGLEIPPRSSCTFCPFHSTEEWRNVLENPIDLENAIMVDELIRDKKPPEQMFVHPSRTPLSLVGLDESREQLRLWDEECSGVCGI